MATDTNAGQALDLARRPESAFSRDEADRLFALMEKCYERAQSDRRDLAEMIIAAKEGKAWAAVGYVSWDDCVRQRFGFTRQRADQLEVWGRTIRELEEIAASGLQAKEIPPKFIGEIDARSRKLLVETIREKVKGKRPATKKKLTVDEVRKAAEEKKRKEDERRAAAEEAKRQAAIDAASRLKDDPAGGEEGTSDESTPVVPTTPTEPSSSNKGPKEEPPDAWVEFKAALAVAKAALTAVPANRWTAVQWEKVPDMLSDLLRPIIQEKSEAANG